MNKTILYIVLGILAIAIISGVFVSKTITPDYPKVLETCTALYTLSEESIINNQSEYTKEQIDWFFNGKCPNGELSRTLWTQKPIPDNKDDASEKVYYCDEENQFIVVKSRGLEGAERHQLTGIPCEELL